MRQIQFLLRATPPFRLDFTSWALRRRPNNAIDRFDGKQYRRVAMIENSTVELVVCQPDSSKSTLMVCVRGNSTLKQSMKEQAKSMVERLLGLRIDMRPFYSIARCDSKLLVLSRRFRGVKPPRFASVFETLVNAIACQQISLNVVILLLNRLALNYGNRIDSDGTTAYSFPLPERLACLDSRDLRSLGFSGHKSSSIIGLSKMVSDEKIDLEGLKTASDNEVIEHLTQIDGIGRWSAEYVLLRGLGRLGVFPGDDVGARNNLQRWLGIRKNLDYATANKVLSHWKPYDGMVYFHLLLDRLQNLGYLGTTGL